MRLATLSCALALAGGCQGELVELDGATAGDLAGGGDLGVHQTAFVPDVQTDMDRLTCTTSICHGSCVMTTPMCLVAMASKPADQMANYAQVMPRTSGGMNALILQKNLATNAALTHTGGKPFPNAMDPTFVKWLAWINAGAPSGLGGGGDMAGAGDMAGPPDGGGAD
jgi:hypothetical protein